MPQRLLLGGSLLLSGFFGLCLFRLGFSVPIACLGWAALGIIFWIWAKSKYALRTIKTPLATDEMHWFCVEITLVFLAVVLSGIGAYFLTTRGLASNLGDVEAFSKEYPNLFEFVRCSVSLAAMALAWLLISGLLFPAGDGLDQDGGHVRGRRLLSYDKAKEISQRLVTKDEEPCFFGGLWLPSRAAVTHFAVVGTTGSGKTLTQRLLMQSVLTRLGQGNDSRAIVYDPKRDFLPLLHGMDLSCPIKTLNPFDKRSVAWDLAADCKSPAAALEIATILIPEEGGHNRFFPDAARHLLSGVLVALMKSVPGNFTFRDVVLALQSKSALTKLLSRCAETRHLVERYLDGREFSSILSTLATKMAPFEIIAAAWSRAKESVSLQGWLDGSYILVLGNDESTRSALDAINQVIIKRIVELVLSQADSETRRTWFFLDEVREAGKLDGLSRLLTTGRSKGACVALGLQDIEGLRDVYGDKVANEILGQCSHKAILRLSSEGTARWACETLGEFERHEYHQSVTQGERKSTTTAEQLVKREAVLASEFMALSPTNAENGLSGFYLSPEIGAYQAVISGDFLKKYLLPRNKEVSDIQPRPETDQYLQPWTAEDLRRLKLSPDPEPPSVDDEPIERTPRLKIVKEKSK